MNVKKQKNLIGIDLFSGAGGMSLGAKMAGIDVRLSIEIDSHAAETYSFNHPQTTVINKDIRKINEIPKNIKGKDEKVVLFGGPPCQGFSTSNRRTNTTENPQNWLYREFINKVKLIMPEWIVFENVTGFVEFLSGKFVDMIVDELNSIGYICSYGVLNAVDFGVPQKRSRFFLIASKYDIKVRFDNLVKDKYVVVSDAIDDLPNLDNGARINSLPYKKKSPSNYAKVMRGNLKECTGHFVSKNSDLVVKRYSHIRQGQNWSSIPVNLMTNYTDCSRCHSGIYYRLRSDEASVVIGNYRKNMLIHPWANRGLSVREAARLQSFPDNYVFMGNISSQQQQVGNAVPPLLAKKVFELIIEQEKTL